MGDADWGKLYLVDGEEGRSAVYDMGSASSRIWIVTENRYGTGQGWATPQIRGDTSSFNQDDDLPLWENYITPILRGWRYVQVRAMNNVKLLLVHDTFTDTPSTSLDAHDIDTVNIPETAWVETNGNWTIGSGNVYTQANFSRAVVDPGIADVEVFATFNMNTQMEILGRYVDENNYWRVVCGNTTMSVIQHDNGADKTRASVGVTLTEDVQYPIWVRFSGTIITATVAGETVEYDGSASQATKFGIAAPLTDVASNFTDFKITTVGKPQASNLNMPSGLLAYFTMNETSGTRADSVGDLDLTDTDTAGYETGLVYTNACDFPTADNPQLIHLSADEVDFGDESFTIAFWIYPYSTPASNYRPIAACYKSGESGGWETKRASNGALAWAVVGDGGTGIAHTNPTNDAWHCIVLIHDADENRIINNRNNGVENDDIAHTYGCVPCGGDLIVGRGAASVQNTDFRLGPLAIWGRRLTPAEIDQWYSGGAGWQLP